VRDQLLKLYSAKVELLEGSGGVFEITQQTKILFSKVILGRFPTNEDLLRLELSKIYKS
jgi:predicted Rdx family selenoprotein